MPARDAGMTFESWSVSIPSGPIRLAAMVPDLAARKLGVLLL
jgi:hypothetical protein